MLTVFQQLSADVDKIKELAKNFFQEKSSIIYERINYDGFFIAGRSDYKWAELDLEGKQLQAKLNTMYNHFYELGEVLVSNLPKESIQDFCESGSTITNYIQHIDQLWEKSTQEVLDKFHQEIEKQIYVIQNMFDEKSGIHIIVPDTNALLDNYNFEKWNFEEFVKFEIVILPTVLSELDKLKVYHGNKEARDKARSIITRIKEYRRRGRLTDGVPIIKNKISLRTLPYEPKFEGTLSWLDPYNNDDRFLASFIEIMKLHINSVVVMITSDINLQNKAEFARLPFIEPPIN